MSYISCVQGSAEWFEARCGRVTASHMVDVLSVLKRGGESRARFQYKLQLIAEVCTGKAQENYVSPAMQYGIEQEPFARAAYEISQGVTVDQVGFFVHPEIEQAGASPDGVVADTDGLIEIKCPNTVTHLEYMLAGIVPEEYQPQMLWQMACSGRKWCDFVSYDPRMPAHLQLFIKRLERDDKRIADYEHAVLDFLGEMDALMLRLSANTSQVIEGEVIAPEGIQTDFVTIKDD